MVITNKFFFINIGLFIKNYLATPFEFKILTVLPDNEPSGKTFIIIFSISPVLTSLNLAFGSVVVGVWELPLVVGTE
jgi:hypothetical protein